MIVIPILIILSLLLAVSFLFAFLWAVKSDQFDDTYTPSLRILMDLPVENIIDPVVVKNENNGALK